MFSNPLVELAQNQMPFLTMYGEERLELGGKVVVNWLNKLVNYYLEELALEPGQTVMLDLPLHWRTFLWLQAGWLAGLDMRMCGSYRREDKPGSVGFWQQHSEIAVVVSVSPEKYQDAFSAGCAVVGVELSSLSLRYRGNLPDFAEDGNAVVLAQSDVLLSEVTFPYYDSKIVGMGRLRVFEVDSEGEEAAKSQPYLLPQGEFNRLANRRVLLQLDSGEWEVTEVSSILLQLWKQGASAVLIKTGTGVKQLLRAEKVNICLEKY